MERLVVQCWERARVAQANGADRGIRRRVLTAIIAATKHLALGFHLDVDFETDDWLEFHRLLCLLCILIKQYAYTQKKWRGNDGDDGFNEICPPDGFWGSEYGVEGAGERTNHRNDGQRAE